MKTRSVVAFVLGALVVVALTYGVTAIGGFSARTEPTRIERTTARLVRHWAVPPRGRQLRNPVPVTEEASADGRAHFADHCAVCHANDGSGQTTIGQNLYPKALDIRIDDPQRLTHRRGGNILQNGIRLTGMPAWGKEGDEDDEDSWKLVHFIRHLRELTPAQLKDMKGLNPK